jgi:transposase InsO family protein
MHVTSKSGRLYIIDDFSSYVTVWPIFLRSKDDAAVAIKVWQRLTENLSGARLKYFVTDNCELLSKSVSDWCDELDIEHQLTAPYTSAQNGRAERLHWTLMEKARTMHVACNVPLYLWDEFCATAATHQSNRFVLHQSKDLF